MRAVVVSSVGADAGVADFPEPPASDSVARVVAAPLNPVDRVIAAGTMAFRRLVPPAVAGLEGVARTPDGELRYFFAPPAPYGSFAEFVPLAGAETTPVPDGLDEVRAAALGVPGVAAWLALTRSGHLAAGESVLVLGATGAVGTIAVQAARALGAGIVVGTARSAEGLDRVERLGGTPASVADPAAFDTVLGTVAPNGFDVIVDLLWGTPLAVAATHLARDARVVQVGNSAGPTATINAPAFRNKGAILVGHSNFLASTEERLSAFAQLAGLAATGELEVAADPIGFDDFDKAWHGEGPAKPVLIP
ncbi:zinc-binding dehydrogenase [Brooklawnia cerclae]|uniref:NADPH:quinone reductase-like Zn-dependent oxidoreductase n=1 Tax=Brooklawnia cerclae TaxID=349934 RepID=A0ABX0SEJ3_9ACTN|nr:zinc-binding dehydrogenase [Brooklawnia cerclae]NIH56784.1 NADPH:quinone reductase-like Zn-dependent oxidoreductase [Brooklawnia cerclae]